MLEAEFTHIRLPTFSLLENKQNKLAKKLARMNPISCIFVFIVLADPMKESRTYYSTRVRLYYIKVREHKQFTDISCGKLILTCLFLRISPRKEQPSYSRPKM